MQRLYTNTSSQHSPICPGKRCCSANLLSTTESLTKSLTCSHQYEICKARWVQTFLPAVKYDICSRKTSNLCRVSETALDAKNPLWASQTRFYNHTWLSIIQKIALLTFRCITLSLTEKVFSRHP